MKYSLLLSPLARTAYFADWQKIARAELAACGFEIGSVREVGTFCLVDLEADESDLQRLSRLSAVQGVFSRDGESLLPLDVSPGFSLPDNLVFGQKYQGKTNELVTQLAINVGLANLQTSTRPPVLLDPMAGRGTTLLWALRYGMNARGIEVERKNLDLFQAHVKKQCKLHRISHNGDKGRIGKSKAGGSFQRFEFEGRRVQLVHGDSAELLWQEGQKFDLVVSDLPYGIQHVARDTRNPFSIVEDCAPAWVAGMRMGAVMVLIFNEYQTHKADLAALFEEQKLEALAFAAPHRMSESIVRDILVLRKPA